MRFVRENLGESDEARPLNAAVVGYGYRLRVSAAAAAPIITILAYAPDRGARWLWHRPPPGRGTP